MAWIKRLANRERQRKEYTLTQVIKTFLLLTGAQVWIDSSDRGITPLSVVLERSTNHNLRIEVAGYEQAEFNITRKWNNWIWGNLTF